MILLTSTFACAIVAVMPRNGSTSICRLDTRPALPGPFSSLSPASLSQV